MFPNLNPAITIVIALMPAMLALALGRGLSRHLDDPLLPERLFAVRRRTGPVFGVGIGLLLATSPARCYWAIPLLVFARMASAYPFRKALHGETWSVGAYLSFFIRLVVAVFGLWTLLAMIPFAAMAAGSRDWIVGVPLAAIVVAWHRRYSAVFRWMLRSRPVDDAEVLSRFGRLAHECGLPAVGLERVDLHGGTFANGVALPSIRWPAVVVTETLIARLDRDETMAILAHELAHLEFYNPSRLRRNNAIVDVLAVIAALWHTVFRAVTPQTLWAAPLFWPVLLLAVGVLRAQHRQKHETESDLRAAELTGNPDAVIRALTKLHAFARLPRRWDAEFERHATHPSLARRIQAIRAAAGTAQTTIAESATFSAPQGGVSVSFHEDHLEWREAGSTIHTLDYGQLGELRIRAHGFGRPRLVAVDSTQRRLEMPLASADVVRMQSVLDVVDTRLAKVEAAAAMPHRVRPLLSLLAIFAGLAAGQMSVLIVGLLELIRPAPQMAAALGTSAVAAAVLGWRDGGPWSEPYWVVLTLLLSGASLIGVAFANRAETTRKITPRLVAVLAGFSVLMWTLVLMHGVNALELHRSTLEWPGALILTLGLAGAFAFSPSPRMRWAAVPVTLAALSAGFLRSDTFVDRFVTDSFVTPAPAMKVTSLTGAPIAEFSIGSAISKIWISKNGLFVAFREGYDDEPSTIRAGRAGGPLAEIEANEALFLDETRLLLLRRQEAASELRVIDLSDGNRETWSIRVPVLWPALSIDRASQRWRLLGRDSNHDFESAEGQVGDSEVSETHWKAPSEDVVALTALTVSNGAVLIWGQHFLPELPVRWTPFFEPALRTESRLWRLDRRKQWPVATSRTHLDCRASVLMGQPAICSAFDGGTTRFFAVGPDVHDDGRPTALAAVPDWALLQEAGDRGWSLVSRGNGLVAFNPTQREAISVAPSDGERPSQMAVGETVVGSVSWGGEQYRVRVYSLPKR